MPQRTSDRAVVASDGRMIRLVMYRDGLIEAMVELDPMVAIRLAGSLIDAAGRHLHRSPSEAA